MIGENVRRTKEATTFRLAREAREKLAKIARDKGFTISHLVNTAVKEFLASQTASEVRTVSEEKPSCAEFIVAAARHLRPKPANISPSVSAGTALYKIYAVAMEAYTGPEFHQGLHELLNRGETIVFARVYKVKRTEGKEQLGHDCNAIIKSFSSFAGLDERVLRLDGNGEPVAPDSDGEFKMLRHILLYVKADGLPEKVSALLKPFRSKHGITAQKIIESMRKQ